MHRNLPKNINEHGNKPPVEDEEIRIIGTTPEISTSFSPIGRNIVIPQTHHLVKENRIIIGNLVDNITNLIINHSLLPIHCIINHNLLLTTNVNSIIRIEEQNKLVPKMIMIEKKWGDMEIFIVEYLHLTKKVPIIQLGNNYYTIEKNPNNSSLTYLRTETRCTNKKVTSIFSIKR